MNNASVESNRGFFFFTLFVATRCDDVVAVEVVVLVDVFDLVLGAASADAEAVGAVRAQTGAQHGQVVTDVLHFRVATTDVVVALQDVLEQRHPVHTCNPNSHAQARLRASSKLKAPMTCIQ